MCRQYRQMTPRYHVFALIILKMNGAEGTLPTMSSPELRQAEWVSRLRSTCCCRTPESVQFLLLDDAHLVLQLLQVTLVPTLKDQICFITGILWFLKIVGPLLLPLACQHFGQEQDILATTGVTATKVAVDIFMLPRGWTLPNLHHF